MQRKLKGAVLLWMGLTLSSLSPASLCAGKEAQKRLSSAEAELLVAAWVKNHEKSQKYHEPAKNKALHQYRHLHEITPQASWERLGVQVFASEEFGRDISWGVHAVYIKNKRVYPLNTGEGAGEVTSLCVCDQTQEGTAVLVYTYVCGSGIERSEIAILFPTSTSSTRIEAFAPLRGAELFLDKQKDQIIRVYASPFASEGKPHSQFLLGRLALSSKNKHPYLHVVLEPNLPKEWRERVWNLDR